MKLCLNQKTNLSWQEVVFDAVLESFALDLHRGDHKGVAKEVRRVTHAFARAEAMVTKKVLN